MKLCLNCGSELHGAFCHQCGQKDEPRIPSFRVLAGEAVAEVLAVDGRLRRTLHLLFRKPGLLTNEYLAGRRARQIPPFRLYLIVSVAYFLALAATGFDTFFFFGAQPGSIAARYLALLPKLMFLILPAVAVLLKMLYRERLFVEHWVVALHMHTALFGLLTLHTLVLNGLRAGVLPRFILGLAVLTILLPIMAIAFAYLFVSLRRVYGRSRIVTLGKLSLLIVGYAEVLIAVGALVINADRFF